MRNLNFSLTILLERLRLLTSNQRLYPTTRSEWEFILFFGRHSHTVCCVDLPRCISSAYKTTTKKMPDQSRCLSCMYLQIFGLASADNNNVFTFEFCYFKHNFQWKRNVSLNSIVCLMRFFRVSHLLWPRRFVSIWIQLDFHELSLSLSLCMSLLGRNCFKL